MVHDSLGIAFIKVPFQGNHGNKTGAPHFRTVYFFDTGIPA